MFSNKYCLYTPIGDIDIDIDISTRLPNLLTYL